MHKNNANRAHLFEVFVFLVLCLPAFSFPRATVTAANQKVGDVDVRAVERQAALATWQPSLLWRSDGNLAAPTASMVLHSPHPARVVLNSPPSLNCRTTRLRDGKLSAPAASMVLHSPHPVGVVLNSPPSTCPDHSTSSGFIGSTGKDPTVRRKATGATRFQKT